MDTQSPDLSGKLEAVVHMLNQENAVRANADATLTGKLDALAKITATDVANTNARIDATAAIVAGLMADVAAIKQANDIAALAAEVCNMRNVLEQLLTALTEEFEEDDFRQAMDGDGNLIWPLSEDDQ